MVKLAGCCLLWLLAASATLGQASPAPSAQEVIDKMVSVYASCSTYSDTGRVRTVFYPSMSHIVIKRFSTAFVRPSQFRFEFETDDELSNNNFVAWRDGKFVKSWWSLRPQVELFEDIASPLSNAAGISSGSSILIPSMLMKLEDTQLIQKFSQIKMSDDKVDGRPTHKVEGKDWRGNPMSIWIDKENFLVLKIYQKQKTERFEADQTTTYKPRINTPMTPGQLAFGH